VQKNHAVLELCGSHQLLRYVGDVNLLGDNINTVNKNRGTLIDAGKEVGLNKNVKEVSVFCSLVTIMLVQL
jgi:hypothetical protein